MAIGVGSIFSRGVTRGFFQIFLGRTKSGEIYFFPVETKKITFFC